MKDYLPYTDVLVVSVLVALWVAAWLNWIFVGHLRQYGLSLLPDRVIHIDRPTLRSLTSSEVQTYILCDLAVPEFVRKLLTCTTCCSFHCAWSGYVVAVIGSIGLGVPVSSLLWLAPIAIPFAAALGLLIHNKTHY